MPSEVVSSRRRVTPVAFLAVLLLVSSLAGCGLRVQTNLPYTPADGVNVDAGNVHVRNLAVISTAAGRGTLSATLYATLPDALTTVAGKAIAPDGKAGTPLSVTMAGPVELGSAPVQLDSLPAPIELRGADLRAGLTVELTLGFRASDETTVRTVVVDGNLPQYATISPSPTPTP
jgi:predicted small lipoprotein YifL